MEAETEDLRHAVKRFRAQYPGADIVEINGQFVLGLCELCLLPIFAEGPGTGVIYHAEDNFYTCQECNANESRD